MKDILQLHQAGVTKDHLSAIGMAWHDVLTGLAAMPQRLRPVGARTVVDIATELDTFTSEEFNDSFGMMLGGLRDVNADQDRFIIGYALTSANHNQEFDLVPRRQ